MTAFYLMFKSEHRVLSNFDRNSQLGVFAGKTETSWRSWLTQWESLQTQPYKVAASERACANAQYLFTKYSAAPRNKTASKVD